MNKEQNRDKNYWNCKRKREKMRKRKEIWREKQWKKLKIRRKIEKERE